MNEVVGHVERNTYISRSKFNSSKRFINLMKGGLDLDTMELHEHTSEFLSTIIAFVDYKTENAAFSLFQYKLIGRANWILTNFFHKL